MSEDATLDEFVKKEGEHQRDDERTVRGEPIPTDWNVVAIEDISEKMGDGGTPSRQGDSDYFGGDITWVVVDDVEFEIEGSKEKLTEKGLNNSSATPWPEGSVIVTTGASIGEVGIAKQPTATKQGITGIIPSGKINSHFLGRYLEANEATLNRFAQGTTFEEIRPYVLRGIEMPLPPLPEQRKIATVLYTVDRAIEKTEEIISQLSTIRHGVRQGIFRTDRTERQTEKTKVGPITIEIPSNWEVRPLGEFVDDFIGGATLSKDDFTEFGVSVLPKKAVNESGVATVAHSERQFCSEETADKNKTNLVNSDYLITALRDLNADAPNIGRIVGIEPDSGYPSGEEYLLAQGVHGIKTNSEISDKYLTEISHSDWYRRYVKSISVGSTQIHIRNDEFLDIQIPVPLQEEQEQIATVLRDIISLQSKEQASRNQLQRLKRGLMQDLLSGKVRTTDTNIDVPEEIAQHG